MQTYNSRCKPCLSGSIHPTHDNGEQVDVGTDPQFSQLPQETPWADPEHDVMGDIHAAIEDARTVRATG